MRSHGNLEASASHTPHQHGAEWSDVWEAYISGAMAARRQVLIFREDMERNATEHVIKIKEMRKAKAESAQHGKEK